MNQTLVCLYLKTDHHLISSVYHSLIINEIAGGLFETADRKNTLIGFNKYNCNHYTITPVEGTVLFPSKTLHPQKFARKMMKELLLQEIFYHIRKNNADYHQGCTSQSVVGIMTCYKFVTDDREPVLIEHLRSVITSK